MTHARKHHEPDSPRAWLMAAAAFFAAVVSFGALYSFGAFFKPMVHEFNTGRGATSMVFSLTAFAFLMLGPVTGRLSDRTGPRLLLVVAGIAIGTGLILTAFVHSLWLACITWGLGVGLGLACSYVPMLAIVSGWFVRRRGTALGIAAAGIGCGILVMVPLSAALIERYGWRDSDIILGVVASVVMFACATISEAPPLHIAPPAPRSTLRAVWNAPFAMLYSSWLLSSIALYIPFVYLPSYAHDRGVNQVAAALLVGFIGGTSLVSRLGMGALADRVDVFGPFKAAIFILGASFAVWLFAGASYWWMTAFAIVMGVGYGGRIAVFPVVVTELFGTSGLGSILGLFFTSAGFSALIGPPLAGFIVDRTGSYHWAIAFALVMGMAGFAAIVPLRRDYRVE